MADQPPQVATHEPPPMFHAPPPMSGRQQYMPPQPPTVPAKKRLMSREPAARETPTQTCYVNHINEKFKPLQLKSMLRDSFCKFGEILDVSVKKSLKTRGQGWVTFSTVDAATKALEALDQTYFLGKSESDERPVQVNFSRNKAHAVAKLDGTFTPRNTGNSSDKKRKRDVAGEDSSVKPAAGRRIKRAPREKLPAHSILLLKNIENDVTQEALESMFSSQDGYKKIRYIQMRHVAFIDFVDIASAVGALKEVDKSRPHFDINFAKQ